jgi:hypothetical protein
VTTYALYAEAANYTAANGMTVTVVAAQFTNTDEAGAAFEQLFAYSRLIGRIGNYAMIDSRAVDYYYSSTRNMFSFTWTNGAWIYTVSTNGSLGQLDTFMTAFGGSFCLK